MRKIDATVAMLVAYDRAIWHAANAPALAEILITWA